MIAIEAMKLIATARRENAMDFTKKERVARVASAINVPANAGNNFACFLPFLQCKRRRLCIQFRPVSGMIKPQPAAITCIIIIFYVLQVTCHIFFDCYSFDKKS